MIRATTSASNIFRRQLCPGSERLEHGLPEEDSAQSIEGTLLHQYDANPSLDRTTLKPAQQDLLKISGEIDDFVFARVSEQFGIEPTEPFEEGRERELLALEGTKEETPGHCDRWRYYAGYKLYVIVEKKFGYKETTPAAANYQLRTYAIAGAEEWDADRIVVAITQPRLSYDRRVTMASYEADDLEASEKELHSIRVNSRKPDAPLVAGEEQCRYCKAKMLCEAYKAKFTSIQQYSSMALDKCTDGQLDDILVAIQFSDFIKEQARDEARRRVEAGLLTNWTLGKASEMRTVADSKRAISLLALRGLITRDDALECSSLKLGKLEEKIREKTHCTWKDAKQIVEETIGAVIEVDKKRPSLTRKRNV
jgi:Protein of unknown function (DUF2800)